MKRVLTMIVLAGTLLMASSCQKAEEVSHAVAVIVGKNQEKVSGIVEFEQLKDSVKITVDVAGLTPGPHGVHIHEYGDLRSSDGKSAGGHYNPDNTPHALPPTPHRHAGSFGNLIADANGRIQTTFTDNTFRLSGKWHPVIGRSIVFHAKEDTGAQPSGAAGARVGVGVIGIAAE